MLMTVPNSAAAFAKPIAAVRREVLQGADGREDDGDAQGLAQQRRRRVDVRDVDQDARHEAQLSKARRLRRIVVSDSEPPTR